MLAGKLCSSPHDSRFPSIVLNFPTNSLAASLERFLADVHNGPGQALRSPIKLDWGGPVGGAVQGIQVIATWAQMPGANRTLRLAGAFGQAEVTRERFASTLPGMAALYFSKAIETDGESFSRFKALEGVGHRVEAMQSGAFQDSLRGPGVALCCFGGARNEYLHALYERPEPRHVRSQSDFTLLMRRLLQAAGERANRALNEGQMAYLSALVYQLFVNADEHGSYDSRGMRLGEVMRGVVLRVTPVGKAHSFVAASANDTPLRGYISRLVATTGGGKKSGAADAEKTEKIISSSRPLWIIELSVFDTGPGLALRWLSGKEGLTDAASMSKEQELEAVRTCFRKHATTKDSSFRGEGLMVALRAMRSLQAFMTVRTGRYSLYQDFSRGNEPATEFNPLHRFAKQPVLTRIAGTAYNITFLAR